jgi:hypothetical protein
MLPRLQFPMSSSIKTALGFQTWAHVLTDPLQPKPPRPCPCGQTATFNRRPVSTHASHPNLTTAEEKKVYGSVFTPSPQTPCCHHLQCIYTRDATSCEAAHSSNCNSKHGTEGPSNPTFRAILYPEVTKPFCRLP